MKTPQGRMTTARRREALRAARATQRGAALLLAMVAVTLVATLAAGMVWQQWRAVQVESAERARAQSGWVLLGALDWSRLILREDGRTGVVDHLGEPWATPLAEARLSTFLAADKDNNADGGPEAFLSGAIEDAQAHYNLRNLFAADGKVVEDEVKALSRLCATAGLPSDTAARLASALGTDWKPQSAVDAESDPTRPLPVQRFDQLAWLGFDDTTLKSLRTVVDILPTATPLNVNTASRDVIAAVMGIDLGSAERIVQVRQRSPFTTVDALKPHLPEDTTINPKRVSVSSSYFVVSGRLRLEERVLEEKALMQRRGAGGAADVVTLHRERRSLHTETP
jgi:general secretion pathway protein K